MDIFLELLNAEITLMSSLGEIINDVKTTKEFTIYEAFKLIAKEDKYINEENLLQYLKQQLGKSLTVYNEDVANFIFRFDKDNDYKLSYDEFKNIFFPYSTADVYANFSIVSNDGTGNKVRNIIMNPRFEKMMNDMKQNDKPQPLPKGKLYFNYTIDDFPEYRPKDFDLFEHNKKVMNNSQSVINSSTIRSIEKESEINPSNSNSNSHITLSLSKSTISPLISTTKVEKEIRLVDLFKEIIHNEVACERLKETLAKIPEINLPDFFSIFDIENSNFVTTGNFKEILKKVFNIVTNDENIRFLYNRYDIDMDGRLSYKEFSDMIIPKKIEFGKMMINHTPPKEFSGFSKNSLNIIKDLMIHLLSSLKNVNKKQIELSSYPGFSAYECFEIIKDKHEHFIYKNDLKKYLNMNGVNLLPFEIDLLMIYINKSNEGKITFNNFIRAVIPHNPLID